jgi:hypothetical protein
MLLAILGASRPLAAAVIYRTGFEAAEGYNASLDLEDQQGWIGTGGTTMGDNGLISDAFPGQGQAAYVGFTPVEPGQNSLLVWRPVNLAPVPTNTPVVRFSVLMSVIDSFGSLNRDCFRWSVYNTNADRLLTVDFDNFTLDINYQVEGGTFFDPTGRSFTNDTPYLLVITMDFGANRWSATLDGTPLVPVTPITTSNKPLNFGDADAVWVYGTPDEPGDNFMLFDNYEITVQPPPAPRLVDFGRAGPTSPFVLRLQGEPTRRYAIEASTNLQSWTSLRTNVTGPDGLFDFFDTEVASRPRRFYRGRLVP